MGAQRGERGARMVGNSMLTILGGGVILRRNCHIGGAVKKRILSIHEVAEVFGVSTRTILRRLAVGWFPEAYKSGPGKTSKWLFPAGVVEAQIKEQQSGRATEASQKKRRVQSEKD